MNARVQALIDQARIMTADERLAALDTLQELVTPPDQAWEGAWAVESEDRAGTDRRNGAVQSQITLNLRFPLVAMVLDSLRDELFHALRGAGGCVTAIDGEADVMAAQGIIAGTSALMASLRALCGDDPDRRRA